MPGRDRVHFGALRAEGLRHRGQLEVFDRETRMRAASAKRVAEKYGLTFVPLQAKFDALLSEAAPADYWLHDGVHPTAMGHAVIAEALEAAFETELKK